MAGASYLRNLEKLYLDDNELTTVAAHALGESQYLSQVVHLSLNYNRILKEGLSAIANSSNFAKLTHLYVE